MVWIVDEKKRAHYKMGRVLEVYHGNDGRVRSALVKTEYEKRKTTSSETGNPSSDVTDETYNSNDSENLQNFSWESYKFHPKKGI